MATAAEIARRLQADLDTLSACVGDVREAAAAWDHEPEVNWHVYAMEWEDVLARLRLVNAAFEQGAMTELQEQQYRQLGATLAAAQPILDRLGLAAPETTANSTGGPPEPRAYPTRRRKGHR